MDSVLEKNALVVLDIDSWNQCECDNLVEIYHICFFQLLF